jgi:2-dehydro-3-deoxygalactonokinase
MPNIQPLNFLSCDWGTTAFRLRLVQSPTTVLAEIHNGMGIAVMQKAFEESELPPMPIVRLTFFQQHLFEQIEALNHPLSNGNQKLPLIISGMASATIGMLELPYKPLPFRLDGSDLLIKTFEPTADFPFLTTLISGIRSENDVMRGEEIQLVGAAQMAATTDDCLYILPGTHSKHVCVKQGQVVDFKTFMTGEIFKIVKMHSILNNSLESYTDTFFTDFETYFSQGVAAAQRGNLLNTLFSVRTNQLFEKNTKLENTYYLSGLLIGAELVACPTDLSIILVANQTLAPFYTSALKHLNCTQLEIVDADTALLHGHNLVAKRQMDFY